MPQALVVNADTILRPRSLENEEIIYHFIDKHRAYLGQWVKWVPTYTRQQLHQDILDTVKETQAGTLYLFDAFYKGEFVGAVDAHDIVAGQSAELGYYIGPAAVGKGLATACTQKLVDFLREKHGIHHFTLEITKGNEPSCRVAQKLGFRRDSERVDEVNGTVEMRFSRER